jgi:hypothetical protein
MARFYGDLLVAPCGPQGTDNYHTQSHFSAVISKSSNNLYSDQAVRGDQDSGFRTGGVLVGTPGTVFRMAEERQLDLNDLQTVIYNDAEQSVTCAPDDKVEIILYLSTGTICCRGKMR